MSSLLVSECKYCGYKAGAERSPVGLATVGHLLAGVVRVQMETDVRPVRIRDDGNARRVGADRKSESERAREVEHGVEDHLLVAAGQVEQDGDVHLTIARCQPR